MYCPKCGTPNDDNAYKCVQCETVLQGQEINAEVPNIPTYLVQAILVTLFCCLPFGIPAIVFAAQVSGKIASGDINGALHSSKQAKMWCWIGFGVGLVFMVGYVVINVLLISSAGGMQALIQANQ